MTQSSKRLVSVLIALLFIVGSLVAFFDLIQPEYMNISIAKGELVGQQSLLTNEQQAVSQAQQLIASYQSQSQNAQNVGLAIPNSQDIAGAIAQIYGIAQNNGLVIQSISISSPSLPAAGQTSKTSSDTNVVKPIGTISFQLAGAGSYESLQNFLSGLETNVRIFNLKSFSIAQASGGSGAAKGAGSQDFFNYSFGIATYYQTN